MEEVLFPLHSKREQILKVVTSSKGILNPKTILIKVWDHRF